jgi:membrane-associated phospholipid phosphatase
MTSPLSPTGMAARLRWVVAIIAGLGCVALASLADDWTYHHIVFRRVYDTDWGRALRTLGYWPLWLIVTFAAWRHGNKWIARWLIASTTVAGIVAEGIKLIVRRERPGVADGHYVFRAWTDHPFSTAGLGMPSSHAIEAFAAAAVLATWLPESNCLWYALAVGCGVTRILSGAHYLSDVVAGAWLGVLVARAIGYVALRATPSNLDGAGPGAGQEIASSLGSSQ